jgi:hypothetical protein
MGDGGGEMIAQSPNQKVEFKFTSSFTDFGFSLSLGVFDIESNKIAVAQPVEFKTHEIGCLYQEMLPLSKKEAQGLMDAMWSAGVRPSNGDGNVGQIGAIKDHLADMRRIAYCRLGSLSEIPETSDLLNSQSLGVS